MKMVRSDGTIFWNKNWGIFNIYYSGKTPARHFGVLFSKDEKVHFAIQINFYNFDFGFWIDRRIK